MTTEPEFTTLKARDLKPYHYGLWSSVEGGEPFSNTICIIRWSEDGEHLWLLLEAHNSYKVAPDEDIEVIPERSSSSQTTRDKFASWVLPPTPKPKRTKRYDHPYKWSAIGPECGACGFAHERNLEPLEDS